MQARPLCWYLALQSVAEDLHCQQASIDEQGKTGATVSVDCEKQLEVRIGAGLHGLCATAQPCNNIVCAHAPVSSSASALAHTHNIFWRLWMFLQTCATQEHKANPRQLP